MFILSGNVPFQTRLEHSPSLKPALSPLHIKTPLHPVLTIEFPLDPPQLYKKPLKTFHLIASPNKTHQIPAMYFRPPHKGGDVEAGGARPLYPMMLENPELRWAFIRKIYGILTFQMLLTVAVASVVVFVHPIHNFFATTSTGLGLYIFLIIAPFIVLCPLYYYYQWHPVNLVLLGIFTLCISFSVGLTCAFTSGKVILESAILTSVVVVSLTLYTFWAARRGHDFSFLGPFLFAGMMIIMVFALIQLFFPMGRTAYMVYGAVAALIFCGYIIYDTDNLIKRYSYDEYVWASVSLYLDIINLFLSLLTLFRSVED